MELEWWASGYISRAMRPPLTNRKIGRRLSSVVSAIKKRDKGPDIEMKQTNSLRLPFDFKFICLPCLLCAVML